MSLTNFHIVFVQMGNSYYMVVHQQPKQPQLSIWIKPTQRCRPINELLNTTIMEWTRIRKVKHYHVPCQIHSDLLCFFDKLYTCLCNLQRHADCLKFDHTSDLTCRDPSYCQNGGKCSQDHQLCPLNTLCICTDCYFGDRCQFYAKGVGLTLDDILRCEIRSNTTLTKQSSSIKISASLIVIMFAAGLINSALSFMTFYRKDSRKVGCGIYLFASSTTSLLTIIMFTVKFWFLIITQMNTSISRFVLRGWCISIEFLLKSMLYSDNWFHACVAMERAATVFKGVSFNTFKSKEVARWLVLILPILVALSIIHEPLYRDLFDDREENRIWCLNNYPSVIQHYNTAILIFHFIVPFSYNLLSAIFIIIAAARHRAKIRTGLTYKQHFHEQFNEHKQLVISSIILVALALPRLIISLLSSCVKSSRNPSLYLFGYFISFVPCILVFIVFVLPSDLYKRQFKEAINNLQRSFNCEQNFPSVFN